MNHKSKLVMVGIFFSMSMTLAQNLPKGVRNSEGDLVASRNSLAPSASSTPNLCAAIRGNGGHLMAHFGGLASIVENFGIVDGASGGSSAAVSIFFYESMFANPLLWKCGDRQCTEKEVQPRLALMLKSIMGGVAATIDLAGGQEMIQGLGKTDANTNKMGKMLEYLKDGFDNPGRGPLRRRFVQRIASRIMNKKLSEFEGSGLGRLINETHKDSLRSYGLHLPPYRRWEILLASQGLDFNTDDNSLLFRQGLLDFPALINIVGRIGDFYANRGPIDPHFWNTMFSNDCLEAAKQKTWEQMINSPMGAACERGFNEGFINYTQTTLQTGYKSSRLEDPVGFHVNSLISGSVIIGKGVTKYNEAHRQYRNLVDNGPNSADFETDYPEFRAAMGNIPFKLDFLNELRFGYWGRTSELKQVEAATALRKDDMKSSLFMNLGTRSWKYILLRSPAEPGLSALVPMGNKMYSTGGWSDLHPIPILKDMGCKKVVYISRTNLIDSEYGQGIIRLFNIPKEVNQKLYDINNPDSSCSRALKAADAVICSDWNSFSATQFKNHFEDSYNAPVATQDPEFKSKSKTLLVDPLPGCVAN